MRVRIRTEGLRLFLAVPLPLVGFAVRCLPERVYAEMQARTPGPYDRLLTKEHIRLLWQSCADGLRGFKGLEIIHVEAADGTYVSVRL